MALRVVNTAIERKHWKNFRTANIHPSRFANKLTVQSSILAAEVISKVETDNKILIIIWCTHPHNCNLAGTKHGQRKVLLMPIGKAITSFTWRPQCVSSKGINVWKTSHDRRSDDLSWWFHTFQKVPSESNFEHLFTVVQSLTDDPLSPSAAWVAVWILSQPERKVSVD